MAPERGAGQRGEELDREQDKTLDPRNSHGGQLGDPGALKTSWQFRELEGE